MQTMHNIRLNGAPESSVTRRRSLRTAISILFASFVAASSAFQPSMAAELPTDSVLLTKHVNKAAEYYDKGEYARAKEEYRAVIAAAPDAVEPYEGLLECSQKTQDWPDVAFAASKIATLSPERKRFYEYDYGTALYNMNRYDEAVPHLKSALATADIPTPEFKPVRLAPPEGGNNNSAPLLPKTTAPVQSSDSGSGTHTGLTATQMDDLANKNIITSETSVDYSKLENFDNAIRSESILIAEYQGYEKSKDIRFNSPPATYWHVDKILKGPPLSSRLPLRYDFHTLAVKNQPVGWIFSEDMLPTKGSKWIIFVEFAVPDGAKKLFVTFDGSYGRQPANDHNLNELDRLLEEHHMKVQGL